jgi:hypothetical protein
MRFDKKWFLVDVDDKENPRSLFAFTDEKWKPKGKNPFYEINGVRYNVVSKSRWKLNQSELIKASLIDEILTKQLKDMDELTLLTKGSLIKEQLNDNGCWKYQEIYVKKEQSFEPIN